MSMDASDYCWKSVDVNVWSPRERMTSDDIIWPQWMSMISPSGQFVAAKVGSGPTLQCPSISEFRRWGRQGVGNVWSDGRVVVYASAVSKCCKSCCGEMLRDVERSISFNRNGTAGRWKFEHAKLFWSPWLVLFVLRCMGWSCIALSSQSPAMVKPGMVYQQLDLPANQSIIDHY